MEQKAKQLIKRKGLLLILMNLKYLPVRKLIFL